ncbi:MAG: hypothetical protein LBF51_05040 [Zoogloeaceae bacterium]|jgi:hypothetical protein|nr:hypothetical protein [Zoogloeaceae bacterium]
MSSSSPSILRAALKAGGTFLLTWVSGSILGMAASVGVAWHYWGHVGIGGGPALAHVGGGAGAIVMLATLAAQPALLVALLLWLFILVYPAVSFFYGWRRALQKIVEAHSALLAERLSSLATERLASLPGAQGGIGRVRKWLAEDSASGMLASALGDSSWARRAARFAARRLPWADLLADWEADAGAPQGADVQSLAPVLSSRIAKALNEIAAPSRLPLIVTVTAHAALLGLGIWLAK